MKKPILSFLALFLTLTAFAQDGIKNLSLVSHLDYTQNLNDVWAYVDGNGREYALVGTVTGLSIVDLDDPSQPQEVAFIPGAQSTWRDMVIYDHYAYTTNETDNGVLIVNLEDLPNQVTSKDTTIGGINTAHNIWQADGYLYVVGTNNFNGGMVIFDLQNDPWNPEFIGGYDERYVHDVYIRDNIAYAAEINDGLLTIINVADKANPTVVGSRDYVNSFTHNTWINDDASVCFTTDELANAYIYSWDVSDPGNMVELSRVRSSLSKGRATPHNTHYINGYLVTSYYADGVNIVDATRPENLVEVGYYDTSPLVGGGTQGCWGAYPYLPSGLILASDMQEGFFVLQPTWVRACYLEGDVTDANTGNPVNGAIVDILNTGAEDLSSVDGSYATGLPDAGSYDVLYAKYGYEAEEITVSLANGMVTEEDVALTPSTEINFEVNVLEAGSNIPVPGANVQLIAPGNIEFAYTANASGVASDPAFLTGLYQVVAGKWGYVTSEIEAIISTSSPSITIYLERGYYDDFIFDFGWTSSGSAPQGQWEKAVPYPETPFGVAIAVNADLGSDFGSEAYVTQNGDFYTYPFDEGVAGGETILLSPMMDLTTYEDPIIDFYWWYISVLNQGNLGDDDLVFEIIDGVTATEVLRIAPTFSPTWTPHSFNVKDFVPNLTPTMFLRVTASNPTSNDLVEAGLDGFQVREGATTAIDPTLATNNIKLYPNPVKESFIIDYDLSAEFASGDLSLEIADIQGRTVHTQVLPQYRDKVKVEFPLPAGMYIATFKHNGTPIAAKKLVK